VEAGQKVVDQSYPNKTNYYQSVDGSDSGNKVLSIHKLGINSKSMSPVGTPQKNTGPGWIRTNVGLRQWVYSPSPLATRAPTPMPLNNAKSNTKKHTSANLRLLYLSRADIARKLGTSSGISRILISPLQSLVLVSAKRSVAYCCGM
jgi:hypothetical protein